MDPLINKLRALWHRLYDERYNLLDGFLRELSQIKEEHFSSAADLDTTWYKDAVVYSTYVDLFRQDFHGLREKLPYLEDLGITCLWLLPILESPLKDAGFDISDFEQIRAPLLGLPADASQPEREQVFADFLNDAHQRGIRLIFDIAINHTSVDHIWFQRARQAKDSPWRQFYHWSDTPDTYPEARLLMKGFHDSNWTWDEAAGQYYLHRFFDSQPDLNYGNPEVLLAMIRMLIGWKLRGVDGIRADAVPFLWKEEGTACESLPQTHLIMKFFRAALDYLEPGTLLLAEACQPPREVVTYFGDSDECQGAYHFPLMPRIYRALAEERAEAVEMVLSSEITPPIPDDCQWFTFLRCHDELTLEMVSPEERAFLYEYYTKDPRWNYRQGEGISARLAALLDEDPRRILLAYSLMLTLPGTPIIFYGDEVGKGNDEAFYEEMAAHSGYPDSRYFVRGRIDWEQAEHDLRHPDSLAFRIYHGLQTMLRIQKAHPAFSRGTLEFMTFQTPDGRVNPHMLAYTRTWKTDRCLAIHNLSGREQRIRWTGDRKMSQDLLAQPVNGQDDIGIFAPYSFYWI